jgi:hypothetical protein
MYPMGNDRCVDCCDRGMVGGCSGCGRERQPTAEELDWAFEDRRRADAAVACHVYARHPNIVCSLGTRGCPLYHGR